MTTFDLLTLFKTALAAVPGVASCKIGLEANITAADYPLVRIVPTRLRGGDPDTAKATLDVTVYFGAAVLEATDGLETVYADLLALEAAIREVALFDVARAARTAGAFVTATYVDTITDEDRLPHYKLMASRFTVEG